MTSSYELRKTFIHIMTHGYKNNIYKFALVRFLLDYCKALPASKLSKMVKTNGHSSYVMKKWLMYF